MKQLLFLPLLFVTLTTSFSQEFELPEDYKFKKAADYEKYEVAFF